MSRRQEIYDRIRETSRAEVILEEMIRLGFWPDDRSVPNSPAAEITRKGELQRELRKLTYENRQLQNVEQVRRQQRKQRLEESKRKRKENKERKLRERKERSEAWAQKKQTEIQYLGPKHSAGLSSKEPDVARLSRYDLQHLSDVAQLAAAMDCSVGLLRYLAFGRKTSGTTHYRRFEIKKKTGGNRQISAPMPRLKNAQRWILDNILLPIELHDAAHGFRPDRSIVSNAQPHVGAKVVINMDMENFFPTVTYRRIKGVFRNIGFSEAVASVLAMICSESEVDEVEIDFQKFYVARGQRFLPQGAPTSPAITNLICRGLDTRLERSANKMGFVYTRYADDITFSSRDPQANVGRAIRRIRYLVEDEDFRIHPEKTRVLRSGKRLEVTGLTVNQKVTVSRKELRKFRATLHQIERDGPDGKSWGNSPDVMAAIDGYANFVSMVDPEKGNRFREQIGRIIQKHGRQHFDHVQRQRWVEPTSTTVDANSAGPGTEQQTSQTNTEMHTETDTKPDITQWWKFW